MQQTQRKPLYDLGQLVAAPGALDALEKSGQGPMNFLSRHVGAIGRNSRKMTARKSSWT